MNYCFMQIVYEYYIGINFLESHILLETTKQQTIVCDPHKLFK